MFGFNSGLNVREVQAILDRHPFTEVTMVTGNFVALHLAHSLQVDLHHGFQRVLGEAMHAGLDEALDAAGLLGREMHPAELATVRIDTALLIPCVASLVQTARMMKNGELVLQVEGEGDPDGTLNPVTMVRQAKVSFLEWLRLLDPEAEKALGVLFR